MILINECYVSNVGVPGRCHCEPAERQAWQSPPLIRYEIAASHTTLLAMTAHRTLLVQRAIAMIFTELNRSYL